MSEFQIRTEQPLHIAADTVTPDVSVIIVNYNVREFLEQALNSVERASAGLNVETYVVDNNSVDGSVAMVREKFPDVHLIANEENVGFATANNQAIRQAAGRYLLILNPDTLLQEDTLRTLVRFMDDHPDSGAAGCRILNPDGSFAPESRRAFPTPTVAIYRMLGMSRVFPSSKVFGRYNLTYLPIDEVCEIDALSGSCMMVRKEALLHHRDELGDDQPNRTFDEPSGGGLFDENFFMYGEDLDWCYRIQQAGWKIYYTPETQIIHYKGESTKKGEIRYVRLFYGAMLRFTDKHFAGRHSRLVALLIRLGIVVRGVISAFGKLLNMLRVSIIDMVAVAAVTLLAGAGWSLHTAIPLPTVYFSPIIPGTALLVVLAIAAMGGYKRRSQRTPHALRPVFSGLTIAFLMAAAVLFFIPDIAFSRAALVLSFVGSLILLPGWRLLVNRRLYGKRRAILVGNAKEAEQLNVQLGRRIDPPLQLVGLVSETNGLATSVRHLGAQRHLRDLVRLQRIDDVIFASDSLSNTNILGMMRSLRDLPVQFKILTEGQDRIIGKASVDDLTTPLREAETFVAPVRSPVSVRILEILISCIGFMMLPFFRVGLQLRPESQRLQKFVAVGLELPAVLKKERALIGYDEEGIHPPEAWGLRPGVVSILDTIAQRPDDIVATHRAYWFYARNQSAALDIEILLRALFNKR